MARKKMRRERDETQLVDGFIAMPVAAKMLGTSESRAYALAAAGNIERRKVGGAVYVSIAGVKGYIASLKPPAGWIPIREAAEAHGYARTSLLYRVRRGQLESREIGGRTYIHGPTLEKLLSPSA